MWTLHFINFKKKARTTPCTDKHIRSSVAIATPLAIQAKKRFSFSLSLPPSLPHSFPLSFPPSLSLACLLSQTLSLLLTYTHTHTHKRYKSTNRSALLDKENNTTKVNSCSSLQKKKSCQVELTSSCHGWPGQIPRKINYKQRWLAAILCLLHVHSPHYKI